MQSAQLLLRLVVRERQASGTGEEERGHTGENWEPRLGGRLDTTPSGLSKPPLLSFLSPLSARCVPPHLPMEAPTIDDWTHTSLSWFPKSSPQVQGKSLW